MEVSASHEPLGTQQADTFAVALFDGEGLPEGAPASLSELIDSGEARSAFKSLALGHADGQRWLLVGLGKRKDLNGERLRVAAALSAARCRELGTRRLCWEPPAPSADGDAALATALVEGTALGDYRFDRFKSPPEDEDAAPRQLEELIVRAPEQHAVAVEQAALVSRAVNRARDLQNRPGNDLTPTALGEYARALGAEIPALSVEVEGRASLEARGMGAFAAVAKGSDEEPALITLRYDGTDRDAAGGGPVLGFVGKAVTFDSGGISLKPGAKMAEMKFDMSGGAAVLEASAAIAAMGLPLRLVTVIGATENLPSGHAIKPGDIVTASNGKTIEINNTDAEGRLVLADCLCHAAAQGAERIVDLATLTGAVIVALGSTYAGVMSNDDQLVAELLGAGETSGETLWRLPLHEEYDALVKGRYADLDNAPEARKAGTIVGGAFLEKFVSVPWAHIDIAGSAWDLDRAYVGKGASGYGVRLLVELARSVGAARG